MWRGMGGEGEDGGPCEVCVCVWRGMGGEGEDGVPCEVCVCEGGWVERIKER